MEGNNWSDNDKNIPRKLKDKVYKMAIKPAMMYGAENWAVRKDRKCACCGGQEERQD